MNGLDLVYHAATNWTIHLNYVAIKLTIIFISTFLIAILIGKGKEQGITTSIIGPLMFYIYYLSATPTLNREIFRLDEQFWFFFLHATFMAIAYLTTYQYFKHKKSWIKTLSYILLFAITSTTLHSLVVMSIWRFQGLSEEVAAELFTISTIIIPLLAYLITSIVLSLTNFRLLTLIAPVLLLVPSDLKIAISSLIITNLTFSTIKNVEIDKTKYNLFSRTKWIFIALITGIIGLFYQFTPRNTIKSISEFLIFNITILGYKIRHNDIILVSTLFLIIFSVSLYKIYKLKK